MTKIYISGAISKDPNFVEKFAKKESELIERGYEVLNPAKVAQDFPNLTYDQYMNIDLAILECADVIYMLEDWNNSVGAVTEYIFAIQNGKEVIQETSEKLSEKYKWHYNYKEA